MRWTAVAPLLAVLVSALATLVILWPVVRAAHALVPVDEAQWIPAQADLYARRAREGETIHSLRTPDAVSAEGRRQYWVSVDLADVPPGRFGVMLPVAPEGAVVSINAWRTPPDGGAGRHGPLVAEIPRQGLYPGPNRIEVIAPRGRAYTWPRGVYLGPVDMLREAGARLALVNHATSRAMAIFGAAFAAFGFIAAFVSRDRKYRMAPPALALALSGLGALAWFQTDRQVGLIEPWTGFAAIGLASLGLVWIATGSEARLRHFQAAAGLAGAVVLVGLIAVLNEAVALDFGHWISLASALAGGGAVVIQIVRGRTALEEPLAVTILALLAVALISLAISRVDVLGSHALMFGQALFGIAGSAGLLAAFVALCGRILGDVERALQRWVASERIVREQRVLLTDQQVALEREISARVILEERERFSRDIHDGVGGSLISLLMQARSGDLAEADLQTGLEGALEDLRLMIDALDHSRASAPSAFSTLQTRIQPAFAGARIELDWRQEDLESLIFPKPGHLLQVYRILQEACTNIVRHSYATKAKVRIAWRPETKQFELDVEDNGKGGASASSSGHGLTNMTRRAATIGGTLEAGPGANSGWVVRLRAPGA